MSRLRRILHKIKLWLMDVSDINGQHYMIVGGGFGFTPYFPVADVKEDKVESKNEHRATKATVSRIKPRKRAKPRTVVNSGNTRKRRTGKGS